MKDILLIIYLVLELLASLLFLLSIIFIVIQSIKNSYFSYSSSRSILAERLLLEQFSEEVYSNHRRQIYYDLRYFPSKNDNNKEGRVGIDFEVKFQNYFDCEGVWDEKINSQNCQNTIVPNNLCCNTYCCRKTNGHNGEVCDRFNFGDRDFDYFFEENKKVLSNCKYFNKLYDKTFHSQIIFGKNSGLDYGHFMDIYYSQGKNYENPNCPADYIKCGLLDSKNKKRPLCFPKSLYNDTCPENDVIFNSSLNSSDPKYYTFKFTEGRKSFVRNIISEIPPNVHEWRFLAKQGYPHEFYDVPKDEWDRDKERYSVTLRNLNKVLGISEKNENKNYYQKNSLNELKLSDVSEQLSDLKDVLINYPYIDRNQKVTWYSTNYIGFETYDGFKQFRTNFNPTNDRDNPMYEISSNILFPSISSAIVGIFLCILLIVYLIFGIIFSKDFKKKLYYNVSHILREIAVIAYLIIYEILYHYFCLIHYPNLDDMDIEDEYYRVVKLYSERRKQKLLRNGVICLKVCFCLELVNLVLFIILCKCRRNSISHNSSNMPNNGDLRDVQVSIAQSVPDLQDNQDNMQLKENRRVDNTNRSSGLMDQNNIDNKSNSDLIDSEKSTIKIVKGGTQTKLEKFVNKNKSINDLIKECNIDISKVKSVKVGGKPIYDRNKNISELGIKTPNEFIIEVS